MATVEKQIAAFIESQPETKQGEMQTLHELMLRVLPSGKLWFSDGTNEEGRTVSNPTIGYGSRTIRYADGTSKEFFIIGLSANKTGISVYVLGLADKKYLADTYGKRLGKATVTGYCIRFKRLGEIDITVLEEALRDAILQQA